MEDSDYSSPSSYDSFGSSSYDSFGSFSYLYTESSDERNKIQLITKNKNDISITIDHATNTESAMNDTTINNITINNVIIRDQNVIISNMQRNVINVLTVLMIICAILLYVYPINILTLKKDYKFIFYKYYVCDDNIIYIDENTSHYIDELINEYNNCVLKDHTSVSKLVIYFGPILTIIDFVIIIIIYTMHNPNFPRITNDWCDLINFAQILIFEMALHVIGCAFFSNITTYDPKILMPLFGFPNLIIGQIIAIMITIIIMCCVSCFNK